MRNQADFLAEDFKGIRPKIRSETNGKLAAKSATKITSQLDSDVFKTLLFSNNAKNSAENNDTYEAKEILMASTQLRSNEPGIKPKTNTAKPFTLKTNFKSMCALIGLASTGSSKYITLTMRK